MQAATVTSNPYNGMSPLSEILNLLIELRSNESFAYKEMYWHGVPSECGQLIANSFEKDRLRILKQNGFASKVKDDPYAALNAAMDDAMGVKVARRFRYRYL